MTRVIVRTADGGRADDAIEAVGGLTGRVLRGLGQVATVPDAALSTLARPARRASAAVAGSGNASNSMGIIKAPNAADAVHTMTKQVTDRAAMRPARA